MDKLTRADLLTLEAYAAQRAEFRAAVLAHKKDRQVALGANAMVYFEDRVTVQYQIQEMLRIERIFEAVGIDEELEAYNPLIPDGSNLKATFMIEYEDVAERRVALERLRGIEDRVWVQVEGFSVVHAIADEDLDRSNDEKTSAVHFLRFELGPEAAAAFAAGAALAVGVDHPAYQYSVDPVSTEQRHALAADIVC